MHVNNQSVGEWCRKGKDDFHGYCRFCDTDIKCDNSGKAQLLQHAKKEKHKQATKHIRSNNQAKLLVTAGAPSTYQVPVAIEVQVQMLLASIIMMPLFRLKSTGWSRWQVVILVCALQII